MCVTRHVFFKIVQLNVVRCVGSDDIQFEIYQRQPMANSWMRISDSFQTWDFTCTELNVNEDSPLFKLICIEFGSCEVRRSKRALDMEYLRVFVIRFGLVRVQQPKRIYTCDTTVCVIQLYK